MKETLPFATQYAKDLCWTSLSPLDRPLEYIVCSYPQTNVTRVVQAETGLEIWFHLDLSLYRCDDALMDDSDFGEAVEQPGPKPVNFTERPDPHRYFKLAAHIFETFAKYQPGRYGAFIAAVFERYGRVDNEDPGGQPRRHLAKVVSVARRATA